LKIKELSDLGGASMFSHLDTTLSGILEKVYPDYEWLPWKFDYSPRHLWEEPNQQRKFMEWAGKQLKIKEMSDWYNVSLKVIEFFIFQVEIQQEIVDLGGGNLLQKYYKSPSQLLSGVFPDYEWLPWKFIHCPQNYWEDEKNQRKFLDWAAKQLSIKDMQDWYKVQVSVNIFFYFQVEIQQEFAVIGGGGLLKKYNNSPWQVLETAYPEYEWLPWKFSRTPKNTWKSDKMVKKFFNWAGKQLGIKEPSDWYKMTTRVTMATLSTDFQDIHALGFTLGHQGNLSLQQLLSIAYPDEKWDFKTQRSSSTFYKKSQYLLKSSIKSMFPNEGNLITFFTFFTRFYMFLICFNMFLEVLEEYRHPDIIMDSGYPLELDFFYPKYNIAFEYQVTHVTLLYADLFRGLNILRVYRIFIDSQILTNLQNSEINKRLIFAKKEVTSHFFEN
jgi:hypothetical protein